MSIMNTNTGSLLLVYPNDTWKYQSTVNKGMNRRET